MTSRPDPIQLEETAGVDHTESRGRLLSFIRGYERGRREWRIRYGVLLTLVAIFAFECGFVAAQLVSAAPRGAPDPILPARSADSELSGASQRPARLYPGVSVPPADSGTPPPVVGRRGLLSHMGAGWPADYLALPIGPGHVVELCGAGGCLELTSTDAGPNQAMLQAGRIADASVEIFETVCGLPASRGLCDASWTEKRPRPSRGPKPTRAASPTPTPSSGFVTTCGPAFCLNGAPIVLSGLNVYNANSRWTCWYPFGDRLDESLAGVEGDQALRAWFYDRLALTTGARDWSKFDETLASARAAGLRVVATLADQWGSCDGGSYKGVDWYASGYRQTWRAFVADVVTRYRDEPTIAIWQLMNEAETKVDLARSCAPDGARILREWAADIAGLVKSIDPNHLLSIGTMGGGQCGAQGDEYRALHAIAGVDVCEYHDYSPEPMPGDQWNGLAVRLDQCGALGKPLLVGELGSLRADRAAIFAAKFDAQLVAGVDGVLLWAWCDPALSAGQCGTAPTYDIQPGDPALEVLR